MPRSGSGERATVCARLSLIVTAVAVGVGGGIREAGRRTRGRANCGHGRKTAGVWHCWGASAHLRLERWRTHETRVRHWRFFWINNRPGGLVSASLAALTSSCQSSSNHFQIPGPQAPSEAKEAGMKSKPAVRASAPCFLVLWMSPARARKSAPRERAPARMAQGQGRLETHLDAGSPIYTASFL